MKSNIPKLAEDGGREGGDLLAISDPPHRRCHFCEQLYSTFYCLLYHSLLGLGHDSLDAGGRGKRFSSKHGFLHDTTPTAKNSGIFHAFITKSCVRTETCTPFGLQSLEIGLYEQVLSSFMSRLADDSADCRTLVANVSAASCRVDSTSTFLVTDGRMRLPTMEFTRQGQSGQVLVAFL